MAALLLMALLLAMADYSSAAYCICNNGVSDSLLQMDIDYACGRGADCSAILQSGACYQPNTVKAHCDYAVNSYYQKMNQVTGSCDFSGTATLTPTLPSTVVSGCTYPASSSQVSATTPTGSTTTPTGSTSTVGSPTSTTGSTTFGFGPTGTDSTGSGSASLLQQANSLSTTLLALFFAGFLLLWVEGRLV